MDSSFGQWLFARLREQSTWVGVVSLISALGIKLSPEQISSIVTLGIALAGAVLVFMPEGSNKK